MNTLPAQATARETPISLHIGGHKPLEGWKMMNIQPGPGVDIIGDIRHLETFESESCARIYCSHVLEHVAQGEVLGTLKGLFRILVPSGKLYISVPDLDVLCHLFLHPRLETDQRYEIMRVMFGGQTDAFDFHYVGFNLDILAAHLKEAGFFSMEQVENFGLFDDYSSCAMFGVPISLNVIAQK